MRMFFCDMFEFEYWGVWGELAGCKRPFKSNTPVLKTGYLHMLHLCSFYDVLPFLNGGGYFFYFFFGWYAIKNDVLCGLCTKYVYAHII